MYKINFDRKNKEEAKNLKNKQTLTKKLNIICKLLAVKMFILVY